MINIPFLRFCVLCGQTKAVNNKDYRPKTLLLIEGKDTSDLGYACDKCLKHLEDGKVFCKPRK